MDQLAAGRLTTSETALDLAVKAFDWICRMKLGPVRSGKDHVGEHVLFGAIHQSGEFGNLRPDLVGDIAPPGAWASGVPWAVAMKAGTTRRLLFPTWGSALRMKWTRHLCQTAQSTFDTTALF
tara:strand:- start:225 stop:593 length:369 start_codon:yes stop_codon:yes gene_type:complete